MTRIILVSLAILIVGCAGTSRKERLSDETINNIAECTGGITGIAGLRGKIEAKIIEKKKSGKIDAEINHKEIVYGVIFNDPDITEDLKKFYFNGYQTCLDKKRNAAIEKENISSLKIESLEFLIDPGSNNEVPEIKLKHPSVYSVDSSDRIMFIAKVGGYSFSKNGGINISYWAQIENMTKEVVYTDKEFSRIDPDEWELKIKSLGISKSDIESVTGAINRRTSTVISNTVELPDKLNKGDYDLVLFVKDNIAGVNISHRIPFVVE